jgi:hypothetical protein
MRDEQAGRASDDNVRQTPESGVPEAATGGQQEPEGAGALALRALAHPVRWKLIDLLGSERSATATRCAEVLGESVASCSYHLGILAKYGYIELVPGQAGREKPWRLTSYHQDLSSEGLSVEGELAAEAAIEAFLDHELARTKDRLRRRRLEPAEWREASKMLGSTMYVTAGELRQISQQLALIAQRHSDRLTDPGRRPVGAREARVFFATSVAPVPGATGNPNAPIPSGNPSDPRSRDREG